MASPRYTKEDMKMLARVSSPGSIPAAFLPRLDYSPAKFKELLESHGLKDDVKHLFEIPIEQVPPLYIDEARQGYLKFRMTVGK
jgi:hypothetical protein